MRKLESNQMFLGYEPIFLVNYPPTPLAMGWASCFSDSATAPSPQALIPTIPAVFLILMNANFLLFRWKNPISKSSNHNANIQLYF
jgi:hypothetical protein